MIRIYVKDEAVKTAEERSLTIGREKEDRTPYIEIPFDYESSDWNRAITLFQGLPQGSVSHMTLKIRIFNKKSFRKNGRYCLPDNTAEGTCETDGNPSNFANQAFFFKAQNPESLKKIYLLVRAGKVYPKDDFDAPQSEPVIKKLLARIKDFFIPKKRGFIGDSISRG